MSLLLATLLPGLLLVALSVPLLAGHTGFAAALKAFPRSSAAANVFFGAGAAWFLWVIAHLGKADLIVDRPYMLGGFAVLAVLSLIYMREFLAVRGLAVLVLLGAMPLLDAAYMEYDHPQRLLIVTPVFVAVALAIWLGASPFRLRDFFEWLFARPGRPRAVGGAALGYGLLLTVVAFTY
jgi:hypothetical protein